MLSLPLPGTWATVEQTEQAGAPRRIWLRGCPRRVAKTVAAQVSEVVGAPVHVHLDAARTCAAQLPPMSAVAAALPRQPMPGYRRCERTERVSEQVRARHRRDTALEAGKPARDVLDRLIIRGRRRERAAKLSRSAATTCSITPTASPEKDLPSALSVPPVRKSG